MDLEVSYFCGLTVGAKFLSWVLFPFYMETYLMHWAHGTEDTNNLDADEYYHLFDSFAVRTQLQQGRYQHGY